MSNQNPTATKSTAIDNEKNHDVAGVDCSNASVVAASSDNKENIKKKEYIANIEIEENTQGADSGFISGPQSSFYEEELAQEKQGTAGRPNTENNFNKLKSNSEKTQHNPKKVEVEYTALDSGCIEEDEEEEIEDYDESNGTYAQKSLQQSKQYYTTSALNITSSHDKNMKLKHDVDAHISERFCNLSLQDGLANNLNAPGRAEARTTTTTTQLPLWEQYYQQNDDGDTYLHLSCLSGHENVVAALIRLAIHPCFLNMKNDYGQTPLHLAALEKHRTILRMLLLAGAEPKLRDSHGNTALHLACMSGDDQCVNALLMPFSPSEISEAQRQHGFKTNNKLSNNLEIRNYDGEFCVHIAAEAGHVKILRLLAYYGADINAREGKGGYTPLHISIEKGNEELFKFLIDECKHKLNLEIITFGRLTAYQFACILKRSKMQSFLEKRGAEPLTPPDSEYDSSDDEVE